MKVVGLFLVVFLGVALTQNCDITDEEWGLYREDNTAGSVWADYEVRAWGMDGGNNWQNYWLRSSDAFQNTRYGAAVCSSTSQGKTPAYSSRCGSCPVIASTCECYPYTDIADNYQGYPGENPSVPPAGWTGDYTAGNPPFDDANSADTVDNCKEHKPAYVYFYSQKMRMGKNGDYELSYGISKGFTPSDESWSDFCEENHGSSSCHIPSPVGGVENRGLIGADYSYERGFYRDNETGFEFDAYSTEYHHGCHMKQSDHRYPSAVYCHDDSGWRYGAGTSTHVRFGCERDTFYPSYAPSGEIVDGHCDSVYVSFDELGPLVNLADNYAYKGLQPAIYNIFASDDCWRQSAWKDYTNNLVSYRTPCSGSGLAVPLFAVFGAVLMVVLRNF